MKSSLGDQLSESRKSRGQSGKNLTECSRLDLQFGDAGTLARNTQKFNTHAVAGGP